MKESIKKGIAFGAAAGLSACLMVFVIGYFVSGAIVNNMTGGFRDSMSSNNQPDKYSAEWVEENIEKGWQKDEFGREWRLYRDPQTGEISQLTKAPAQ